MSHEPSAGWIDRRVHAAMQGDIDALRGAIATLTDTADAGRAEIGEIRAQVAELRTMIQSVGVEIGSRAAHTEASLAAMREAMDRDEKLEALRLRVEGLLAQHRWDSDQLRQSLAAMAERLPLDG
jgi:septation ring formation regulator EzrA